MTGAEQDKLAPTRLQESKTLITAHQAPEQKKHLPNRLSQGEKTYSYFWILLPPGKEFQTVPYYWLVSVTSKTFSRTRSDIKKRR